MEYRTEQAISDLFAEGQIAAEIDEVDGKKTDCPYTAELPKKWWERGYAHTFRLLRAIKAEQELEQLRRIEP